MLQMSSYDQNSLDISFLFWSDLLTCLIVDYWSAYRFRREFSNPDDRDFPRQSLDRYYNDSLCYILTMAEYIENKEDWIEIHVILYYFYLLLLSVNPIYDL